MNKILLLISIFFILNNCSANKKQSFWNKENSNIDKIKNIKTVLTKQVKKEQEFNPTLKIKISGGKLNRNFDNNQNNIGELSYEGNLEIIGKYKFSKFDDFDYIDIKPIFYNENVIFF